VKWRKVIYVYLYRRSTWSWMGEGERNSASRTPLLGKARGFIELLGNQSPHGNMAQASSEVQLKDKVLKTRSASFHCWQLVWRDYIACIGWMLRILTSSVHFCRVQRMLLMMWWPEFLQNATGLEICSRASTQKTAC
jgi:hypothetical protein